MRDSADAVELPGALAAALSSSSRAAVATDVRRLLEWQEGLSGWVAPRSRVAGVPFVALYADGRLRGCMGSAEGNGGERLARAFLQSLTDARFGGIRPEHRRGLVAEVSFVRGRRLTTLRDFPAIFEDGTHGLGLARAGHPPVYLLPNVARDSRLGAKGMLEALLHKAKTETAALDERSLFVFETDGVVVRRERHRPSRAPWTSDAARELGATWLASLVAADGSVTFARDARTGAELPLGEMHHGRAAVVLQALAREGGHEAVVTRGRRAMRTAIKRGLEGRAVAGWPDQPLRSRS